VVLLYPISFGPACWLTSQDEASVRSWELPRNTPAFMKIYCPFGKVAISHSTAGRVTRWWMAIGLRKGALAVVPTNTKGDVVAAGYQKSFSIL